MNIYDFLFIVQYVVVMIIILAKVYNVMHKGQIYNIGMSFILFIAFWFAWIVGLLVVLDYTNKLFYSRLFIFENFFILLQIILLLVECFFVWGTKAKEIISPYNAQEARKASGAPR